MAVSLNINLHQHSHTACELYGSDLKNFRIECLLRLLLQPQNNVLQNLLPKKQRSVQFGLGYLLFACFLASKCQEIEGHLN